MSWSFQAVGKAAAVAALAATDIPAYACIEPEQSIKAKATEAIAAALMAYPDGAVVHLEASGHQDSAKDGKASNTLSIHIRPLYGFVE